jgi:hypothetical protein
MYGVTGGPFRAPSSALLVAVLLLQFGGCAFTRDKVVLITADTPRSGKPLEVTTPVKAHLKDGSVVLFPQGVTVEEGLLRGAGEQYDLARTQRTLVYTVPIDQIAAVEAYEREVRPVESAVGTALAAPVAVVTVGLSALLVFILLYPM